MMNCTDALARIPRFLDEQLDETEAAPLRAHLMDCPDCRSAAQEARSLSAWFVKPEPVAVPDGFAARVARRAMAGDRGALTPVPAPSLAPALEDEDRLRGFLISAVAVAALVLLSLSIALRRMDMPESRGLSADDRSEEQALEALRELNERDEAEERGE